MEANAQVWKFHLEWLIRQVTASEMRKFEELQECSKKILLSALWTWVVHSSLRFKLIFSERLQRGGRHSFNRRPAGQFQPGSIIDWLFDSILRLTADNGIGKEKERIITTKIARNRIIAEVISQQVPQGSSSFDTDHWQTPGVREWNWDILESIFRFCTFGELLRVSEVCWEWRCLVASRDSLWFSFLLQSAFHFDLPLAQRTMGFFVQKGVPLSFLVLQLARRSPKREISENSRSFCSIS